MTRNLKIFFGAFVLSLPFWLGVGEFGQRAEEFFFWNTLANNPEYFTAQATLQEKVLASRPTLKNGIAPLSLENGAAISMFVDNENQGIKVLFEKNTSEPFAIASLTKLMTAYVVARHFPLKEEIVISAAAVAEEENAGFLRVGDRFTHQDLLYPMLMESSNDAAAAFALSIGKQAFIDLMNLEAQRLGLSNTRFVNHAGLDPDIPQGPINTSTAKDLAKLTQALREDFPDIFGILALKEQPLYTLQGHFHHIMNNTNELLEANGWPTKVLGGKTGWTPEAQGALVLVLQGPKNKGYVVNVVLHSQKRFEDMQTMVDWVYDSYLW